VRQLLALISQDDLRRVEMSKRRQVDPQTPTACFPSTHQGTNSVQLRPEGQGRKGHRPPSRPFTLTTQMSITRYLRVGLATPHPQTVQNTVDNR